MRNFYIVTLGLIAGIFGSSMAQNSNLMAAISAMDIAKIPGISDSFILLLKSKEVTNNFITDCDNYGGKTAYKNFQTNVASSVSGLISIIGRLSDPSELSNPSLIFINKICPILPEVQNVTENLLNSYKKCLPPKDRNNIDEKGGAVVSLIKYACENGAQHFLEFFNNVNDECVQKVGVKIVDCFNKSSHLDYLKQNAVGLGIGLFTSDLSEKDCKFIKEFRPCVNDHLIKCVGNKILLMVEKMFGIIDQHTSSCKNLSNKKNSLAAGIEVLPITSLMASLMVLLC